MSAKQLEYLCQYTATRAQHIACTELWVNSDLSRGRHMVMNNYEREQTGTH